MKIALCMIVKNEEVNLKSCLEKAALLAEEIVIVDTGSTDKTKEIAAKFTDKIYDFTWINDFSKARNFSISKASNDWVLVLDADDSLISCDIESITSFISNKENERVVGRIKILNEIDDTAGNRRNITCVGRFFNKNCFHYEGIIHEQVAALDGRPYDTYSIDIEVNHVGYSKEALDRTNKIQRNIILLKQAIDESPNDPYLYYQLGKSYYLAKEYDDACTNFSMALEFDIDFKYEYEESLVESYGYCLVNSARYKESLIIEKYGHIYGLLPDYNFLMGIIYMNNGKFSLAVESFLKCIGAGEGKIVGITSYLPYYNIGVIFECLGYREDAINYYKECGDYEPAVKRLKSLLN